MLNTSTVVLEEIKTTVNICAELNVTEVQTKVAALFAILLDPTLLGRYLRIHVCVCMCVCVCVCAHVCVHVCVCACV